VSGFRVTKAEWAAAIRVFLRERTIRRVLEELGVGYVRAQRMLHHLRVRMLSEVPMVFRGPIEMDETYIGGQRKNKRLHIRRIKSKRGHGTDKLPIMGLFDRCSGNVFVRVLERKLDIYRIIALTRQRALPHTIVYTDGFKMYRMLPRHGFQHAFVDHDGGEMVRGTVHTNNIEGFWGILKRKLSCIGGMRRDRLHFFVAEIVWRFNHRRLPLIEQERALLELVLRS